MCKYKGLVGDAAPATAVCPHRPGGRSAGLAAMHAVIGAAPIGGFSAKLSGEPGTRIDLIGIAHRSESANWAASAGAGCDCHRTDGIDGCG